MPASKYFSRIASYGADYVPSILYKTAGPDILTPFNIFTLSLRADTQVCCPQTQIRTEKFDSELQT